VLYIVKVNIFVSEALYVSTATRACIYLMKMPSPFFTCLVFPLSGGYVRRQAPGTEKKTALKVELDIN